MDTWSFRFLALMDGVVAACRQVFPGLRGPIRPADGDTFQFLTAQSKMNARLGRGEVGTAGLALSHPALVMSAHGQDRPIGVPVIEVVADQPETYPSFRRNHS